MAALRELSEKAEWDILAVEIALSSKLLKSSQVSAGVQLLRAPSASQALSFLFLALRLILPLFPRLQTL